MRDLSRFLRLYETFILEGNTYENSIIHAFQICYLHSINKLKDKAMLLLKEYQLVKMDTLITVEKSQLVRISDEQALLFCN